MTTIRTLVLALLVCSTGLVGPLPAQPPSEAPVLYDRDLPSASFHQGRRAAVKSALPADAVAVFLSAPHRTRQNDVSYEYRQQSDLLYLTGAQEPGTVLVLAPSGLGVAGGPVTEVLFVPSREPAREVWTGRRLGPERAAATLGVETALPLEEFDEVMGPLLRSDRPVVHLPLPEGVVEGSVLEAQIEVLRRAEGRDTERLRAVLDSLRVVKTDEELRVLTRAIDITVEAHREVARAIVPGMHEYEAEALVEYVFKRNGAAYPGFPSIVGSGENSVILHYETNRRRMEAGDMVVIDVGAEYHGYSADVTRTYPVDGVFSPEQRAIYELVLRAQEAGIEEARPGNAFVAPHQAALAVLGRGLAELGLIRSPTDIEGLRRFFMHGTSHYLGLDVHDAGPGGPLEPGTVLTVEPGLYIAPADDIDPKWWNIGVRIEDDVRVTDAGGPEVLSWGAPRSVEEIEALMSTPRAGPLRRTSPRSTSGTRR